MVYIITYFEYDIYDAPSRSLYFAKIYHFRDPFQKHRPIFRHNQTMQKHRYIFLINKRLHENIILYPYSLLNKYVYLIKNFRCTFQKVIICKICDILETPSRNTDQCSAETSKSDTAGEYLFINKSLHEDIVCF